MQTAEQQNNTQEVEFQAFLTDPDTEIVLSEDTSRTDNYPTNFRTTYRQFFERLSWPSQDCFTKDGPGWLNGPCVGRRTKPNFSEFWLGVLDADSSLDAGGRPVEGAPDISDVHRYLSSIGLTHHIHTTHSHGGIKGNRYRVIFPVHAKNASELRGLLLYVTEMLQTNGVNIYLTKESYQIPNRWHYPRIETDDSPFFAATYWGNTVSPVFLARHYHQIDSLGVPVHSNVPAFSPRPEENGSLISRFCHFILIPPLLEKHGYAFRGQQILIDEHGHETMALRYLPPGSDSAPGVIVFEGEDKQRVYSHHTNDPLCTGYALDAYDAFMILEKTPFDEQMRVSYQTVLGAEVDFMNTTYPFVHVGGRACYATKQHDPITGAASYQFLSPTDFKIELPQLGGIYIFVPGDDGGLFYKDRHDWWVNAPERINYRNVFFEPRPMKESFQLHQSAFHAQVEDRYYYNLFTGWTLEPKPGSCDLIKWHILHALCSGNEKHYNYFIQWLAHIVQHPTDKPGVAIALKGEKGIGKSLLVKGFLRAFAPMAASIANSKNLTSQFNSIYMNRLLVVFEESFFSGSPEADGILKDMITGEDGIHEGKHKDAVVTRTFFRVMLITNNAWVVPATHGERRYFVPETSDAAVKRNEEEDGTYFARLANELFGPGMKAFLWELMNTPVDMLRISQAPDSIELQRQKMYALTGPESWLADALKAGFVLLGDRRSIRLEQAPRRTAIAIHDILESMASYANKYDATRARLYKQIESLEVILGRLPIEQRMDSSYITLPPIEEMRESFEKRYGLTPGWFGE